MLRLLLLISLLPRADPPCAPLYERARQQQNVASDLTLTGREELLTRAIEAIRSAKACYEGTPVQEAAALLSWETYDLLELGRPATAEAVLDTFFSRYAGAAPRTLQSYMHSLQGRQHLTAGRLLDALESYQQALSLADPGDHLSAAEHHLNTATVYQRLSEYDRARASLEQAEERIRQAPEGDYWRTFFHSRVQSQYADAALQQATLTGRFDAAKLTQAEKRALRAADQYQTLSLPSEAALALTQAAEAQAFRGARGTADSTFQRALRVATTSGDPYAILPVRYKSGRLRAQQGETEQAVTLLTDVYGSAQPLAWLDLTRRIALDIGRLKEIEGDWSEAETWLRRSIHTTEQYRASLGTSPWASLAFDEWQHPYRALVRVLLDQGKVEEAFTALEQVRARRLHDLRVQAARFGTLTEAQRGMADSLSRALVAVRAQLARHEGPEHERAALRAVEVRIAQSYDRLFGVLPPLSPASVSEIQARLRQEHRTVLSFFIDRPDPLFGHEAHSFVFVLTPDTLAALPIPTDVSRLERLLSDISALLTNDESRVGIAAMHFNLHALKEAYDVLVGPVQHLIPPDAPITVIPDGPLYALPFAALVVNDAAPFDYGRARFFIQEHRVTHALAAQSVMNTPQEKPLRTRLVAIGRSRFSGIEPAHAARSSEAALPDLPGSREEVRTICRLLPSSLCAIDAANAEEVFFREIGNTQVVHLATHSIVRPDAPLYSTILLSGEPTDSGYDGLLHAYELRRNVQNLALVVLSSCSTARGQIHAGEGMQGLHYAFRSAGARSVLSMLWPVEDAHTRRLIRAFYEHLSTGKPVGDALRRAQLSVLQDTHGAARNPFFWAAPTLYGEPGPLELQPASSYANILLPVALFTSALGMTLVWRYRRTRQLV